MGIVLQVYCFDRAIESAMSRMLRQWHLLRAPEFGSTALETEWLKNAEWVERVGCSMHDAHNSLKWGMHFTDLDPSTLNTCL